MMNATDTADQVAAAVNSGIDVAEFQEAVQGEHPYLQGEMFNQVLKPGIVAIAGIKRTDSRNVAVRNTCRNVCDAMGWDY